MKLYIVKPISYCFGVIKAIEMVKKIRHEYPNNNIHIFGMLVHNDNVVKQLNNLNINTIDLSNNNPINILNSFTKKDIVVFTAHGHKAIYEEILKQNGITYFDATCTKVLKNMDLIKYYLKTNEIIYIGKSGHTECEAALSIDTNIKLYDINTKFDYSLIKTNNPIVINQTTLSLLEIKEIHNSIKHNFPKSIFLDEICDATRKRQQGIINIPKDIELIIIVGSIKSSNTTKLFNIASTTHPFSKVIMVNDLNEFKNYNLIDYKYIAIASGTSTPVENIEEIINYLERTYEK